jgi:amino acid transporter
MGWIVVLFCIILIVVVVRKTLDRETAKNLKFLGKLMAAVVIFIILMIFLFYISR